MTPEQKRGHKLLIGIVILTFGSDLFIGALTMFQNGVPGAVGTLVRWLLTAGLLYALWKGHGWARWLMVGLCSATFLMMTMAALQNPQPFYIIFDACLAVITGLLMASKSISEFLRFQRLRKP